MCLSDSEIFKNSKNHTTLVLTHFLVSENYFTLLRVTRGFWASNYKNRRKTMYVKKVSRDERAYSEEEVQGK
jgi:hypothetical protein